MGSLAHDRRIDYSVLGGTLVLGACIVVAIRTARRASVLDGQIANQELESEIDFALKLVSRVLMRAVRSNAEMFRQTVATAAINEGVVDSDVAQ